MSRFLSACVAALLSTGFAAAQQSAIGDCAGGRITAGCTHAGGLTFASTFRRELADAPLVVAGTLSNPRTNPAGDDRNAVTDLKVETLLKVHDVARGAKVLTLPRHIPVNDPKKPPRFLVFIDVVKGQLDPYRGVPLKSDAPVKYLLGAMKLNPKKPGDSLMYFLKHLDSTDAEVSQDAFKEVTNTDYAVLKTFARQLDPAVFEARLRKGDMTGSRRSLDAFLLGHCGTDRHADLLRGQIDSFPKKAARDLDGLLIGYALLKPKEGLALLRQKTSDPRVEFMARYAALRALRFFWKERPDVLPLAEVRKAVAVMLDQEDITDLVIEDLRRQREVRYLERILALHDRKGFELPIIRRAILRFALTFPKNPKAEPFIERMRAEDPERVKDIEEILKLDR